MYAYFLEKQLILWLKSIKFTGHSSRGLNSAFPRFPYKSSPIHSPKCLLKMDCISYCQMHSTAHSLVFYMLVSFSPTWNMLLCFTACTFRPNSNVTLPRSPLRPSSSSLCFLFSETVCLWPGSHKWVYNYICSRLLALVSCELVLPWKPNS